MNEVEASGVALGTAARAPQSLELGFVLDELDLLAEGAAEDIGAGLGQDAAACGLFDDGAQLSWGHLRPNRRASQLRFLGCGLNTGTIVKMSARGRSG